PVEESMGFQKTHGLTVQIRTGYRHAGKPTAISIDVSHAKTSHPATDLEPYLGAAGHLIAIKSDRSEFVHAHDMGGKPMSGMAMGGEPAPEAHAIRKGTLNFNVLFPVEGLYKLWVQFNHGGKTITAPFAVSIAK